MKITSNTAISTTLPQSSIQQLDNQQTAPPCLHLGQDLSKKPAHRRLSRRRTSVVSARTPRKDAGSSAAGKRTGPPTPLLRWKFDEVDEGERKSVKNVVAGDDVKPTMVGTGCQKVKRVGNIGGGAVSVRKLATALWRLQPLDAVADGGHERRVSRNVEDRLAFMHEANHAGDWLPSHHESGRLSSVVKDQSSSPCSVNGSINGYFCEPQASLKLSNYAMEGATKWDPVFHKRTEERSSSKLLDDKLNAITKASALKSELDQAQSRIEELESERRSSKKKLEHFLKKLSQEKAAWRSREHEKVRAIIDGMKADLNRERKNRQRLEIVNSKLVNELAETKVVAKRYMQDYEKERKARELVEEVCDELAKEIGEDKAEVEAIRRECMTIREEADDERKMLQMAEVWREERVQMKLVDAKVTLEDKFSQMNKIIADLESFLKSKSGVLDPKETKEVEILEKAVASVKIQYVKEFSYDPPKSDDIFSVFEEMAMQETSEREIQPCINYSPASHASKMQIVNPELDDDRSGWETVSHADDQGSSFSCEESIASMNKGDETPVSGVSEVCSVQSKQMKKPSSISRLWRLGHTNSEKYKIVSLDGLKNRFSGFSDGRISNGSSITTSDCGSRRGGYIPMDLRSYCSSPDTGPRGQKTSLKSKLLEARMGGQKIQLRQVLKHEM